MRTQDAIRPPAVAGFFYPADPVELTGTVDRLLAAHEPDEEDVDPEGLRALIVPHAGYIYSGPTAAHGYRLLARLAAHRPPRRVAVLGPTHRVAIRGLALPAARRYATPLGVCPVDASGLDDLPQVAVHAATHAEEHSLEVQVPFLQRILGDIPITPLAVGLAEPDSVAQVIETLAADPGTFIVISSDLSHYHAHDEARRLDDHTISRILERQDTIPADRACGAHPLNGMLHASRRLGWAPHILARATSADTAGNPSRVVGYACLALNAEDTS